MLTCKRAGKAFQSGKILKVHGGLASKAYRRTPVPAAMAAAYYEMVSVVPELSYVPQLIAVEDAGGAGGLYLTGGGPIVVGHRDVLGLALRYVRTFVAADLLVPMEVIEWAYALVYGRIVAHELGHALDESGFYAPFSHPEARADYLAGMIDAARGKDRTLGARLFWGIGCAGPACTHPPHDMRAEAYLRGYRDQVSASCAVAVW